MKVTLCGHRKIEQTCKISKWLDIILSSLIEGGAATFYLGGYGVFDNLAAAVLRDLKKIYPHIQIILVLAYLNRNSSNASGYDSTLYPELERVPPRFAIFKRNERMVETSDVVVAYVTHGWGGAATTLKYARRKKKSIVCFPNKKASFIKIAEL